MLILEGVILQPPQRNRVDGFLIRLFQILRGHFVKCPPQKMKNKWFHETAVSNDCDFYTTDFRGGHLKKPLKSTVQLSIYHQIVFH